MAKMNFYTQNGWAGSNYDSKLQTKDIAKKVREFAKKNFPAFKFSVRSEWSMYTDSMYIILQTGHGTVHLNIPVAICFQISYL